MRFYLYNGNTLVIDSGNLYDETLLGGRMGVFCLSQPKIIWSNMKYSCNRKCRPWLAGWLVSLSKASLVCNSRNGSVCYL